MYFTYNSYSIGVECVKDIIIKKFGEGIRDYINIDMYLDTIMHLFRVVCSIESMVIGENQILSQCREAFKYSSNLGCTNKIFYLAFDTAFKIGKKVRAETQISNGKVSIPSIAVDMVEKVTSLSNKQVLLIGNGKMAKLIAEYLKLFDISNLFVVGRNNERVQNFCKLNGGQASDFKALSKILTQVDIVFSATSAPKILVKEKTIRQAMVNRIRPLILVDIAVPSDIDPLASEIPNVQAYSIKDLKELFDKNLKARSNEIQKVEEIIEEGYCRFIKKLQNFHINRYFAPLIKYIDSIRNKELEKAICMFGSECNPRIKKVLDGFSKSLVKKIFHNFLTEVRTNPLNEKDMKKFTEIFTGCSNIEETFQVIKQKKVLSV